MSSTVRSFGYKSTNIAWGKLIACLAITMGIGQISMWLSGAWQGHIGMSVSTLTPTPYLMGIIWSILFLFMGASLYSALNQEAYTIRSQRLKNTSLTLFAAQFVLLIILPFILFSQHLYMLTFVTSSLITAIVAALAIINLKITKPSSVLLLPYLAWMVFETYLSLIILLNNF